MISMLVYDSQMLLLEEWLHIMVYLTTGSVKYVKADCTDQTERIYAPQTVNVIKQQLHLHVHHGWFNKV